MCLKVSEKPKRAEKPKLNINLDIIKCFNHCEKNKNIVRALNLGSGHAQNFFQINEWQLLLYTISTYGMFHKMLYFQIVVVTCIRIYLLN